MKIDKITIRERGSTPRRLAKVYTASSKAAWSASAKYYHLKFRPLRFTQAHGKAAGYAKRSGDDISYGSKAFWRSYVGRKIRKFKHNHPLEWSGKTRRGSAFANIATTRVQAKVKYPQVRVLNFKPHLQAEFRRLLPSELPQLGRVYDRALDRGMKADKGTETRTI